AIEFSQRFVELFLLDEQMNEACADRGIGWLKRKVFAIRVGSFRFFLGVEAFGKSARSLQRIGLGLDDAAELRFGLGRLFQLQVEPREVHCRFRVAGIKVNRTLERIGGAGEIAGSLLRYA